MKPKYLFAVLLFTLTACGPAQANLEDEAGANSAPKPAAPAVPACSNAATTDCDGDGRVGAADCAPTDMSAFLGANEICADGKDNDCDGLIDDGCQAPVQPAQPNTPAPTPATPTPATADSDRDGYPDGPQDCAPQNSAIHPGATEVCADSVDNNCDGVVDENCPVVGTNPPPPAAAGTLSCTFTWPTARQRSLNVQAYDDRLDLGGWWDRSESGSGQSLTVTLQNIPQDICGFRLNTSEGNPPTDWFCEGNGSTANLDPTTTVACSFANKSANKSGFRIWSAPGGTNSGCSAVWVVTNDSDCW